MTMPLLGTFSVSGFHPWLLLFFVVIAVLALLAAYVVAQRARRRRVLRFANLDLLAAVSPPPRRRWRHLPAALLVASLALLTTAMAGPTDDVRVPRNRAVVMLVIDVSESMVATDVAPNRLAAAKQAGKRFADELTPGINLGVVRIRRYRNTFDDADDRPGSGQGGDRHAAARRTHRDRRRDLHRVAGDRRDRRCARRR